MKKSIIASAIILTFTLNIDAAKAKASTEENVGFFSGALTGAVVGGPVGFIIGGVVGALGGDQVNKANQLGDVKAELNAQKSVNHNMQQEIVELKQQTTSEAVDGSDWITEGLTLNLMFTTNSSDLSENDHQMISRLSDVLNEYPELNVRLDGYADPRGDEISNMKLSEARTQSVKQAFAALGISASRLVIKAHGESQATENEGNLDAYALERRVSVNFFTNDEGAVAQN